MKRILLTIYALLLASIYVSLNAQTLQTVANKPCNMGREFFFTFLPILNFGSASIYVIISSPVNTRVRFETETGGVIKDVIVEAFRPKRVDISSGVAMPFSKTHNAYAPPDAIYPGVGIHVTSDFPIAMYGVNIGGYTGDTFLILPVETLGKEYIVASVPDASVQYPGWVYPSITEIVAIESNTQVQITLGGTTNVKTAGGQKYGESKIVVLNKGDVYVISTDSKQMEEDFSGTKITASKPVAVISGNYCSYIPSSITPGDYLIEMQMPTYSWGKNNFIPRYSKRKNSYLLKAFAKEPLTNISFNGSYIKTLTTSGGAEGSGYMYRRSDVTGNNVAIYSGNKPISCTVYNTGNEDGVGQTDPFTMTVIPYEQYSKFLFYASPYTADLKYDEYFGVVFPLTENATIPDDLEFGTVVSGGELRWQKFSSVFGSSVSLSDRFQSGSTPYGYKECSTPGPGIYALRCSKSITIYSYAGSNSEGHGTPLTTLMIDLTKLSDTIKPEFKYMQTDSSTSGTVTDLPKDDAVRSNLSKVFLNYGSYNMRFTAPSITSPTTPTLAWQLEVVDTQIPALAIITATDRAGNDTTITITYTPKRVIIKPKVTHTALTVCQNDTVNFSCNDGFRKYEWSTGDTTKTIKVQCINAGAFPYWVTVTNDSGIVQTSDTLTVVVNALPKKTKITQHGDTLITDQAAGVEYTWYKDGVEIASAKSYMLIITRTGVYMVRAVYQQSGCLSQSEQYYGKVTQTDMQECISTQKLQIIPNPATNITHIQYSVSTDATLEIVNTLGMVIMKLQLPKELNSIALNLQALPQDIYQVRMQSKNDVTITTLIVQR